MPHDILDQLFNLVEIIDSPSASGIKVRFPSAAVPNEFLVIGLEDCLELSDLLSHFIAQPVIFCALNLEYLLFRLNCLLEFLTLFEDCV